MADVCVSELGMPLAVGLLGSPSYCGRFTAKHPATELIDSCGSWPSWYGVVQGAERKEILWQPTCDVIERLAAEVSLWPPVIHGGDGLSSATVGPFVASLNQQLREPSEVRVCQSHRVFPSARHGERRGVTVQACG